jgi:hypothetical protein
MGPLVAADTGEDGDVKATNFTGDEDDTVGLSVADEGEE